MQFEYKGAEISKKDHLNFRDSPFVVGVDPSKFILIRSFYSLDLIILMGLMK